MVLTNYTESLGSRHFYYHFKMMYVMNHKTNRLQPTQSIPIA